ncbi:hypothetical protein BHE74_00030283 [Ensete ventricosum]|nr:hypothetical protein BHE74_00030283 [Ensete ventricosum]
MKLQPGDEPRSDWGSDDVVGSRWSSLEIHRRDREARWEHAGRSSKEDRMTYRKNVRGYRIDGSWVLA